MKTVFSGITFLFISLNLFSQTIRLSQKYTTQTLENIEFKSYLVNDYFYVLHGKSNMKSPIGHDVQMDVFDNKGEFVSSSGLIDANMAYNDPNLYEGIFPMKENMVLFKSCFKKEGDNKHMDLFYYPFVNLTQHDKGNLLTSITAEGAMNSGSFKIATSPDGTKLAVIAQQPYVKMMREKIQVTVYDNTFNQLWTKSYEFPFDNIKYPVNEVWVNNRGSVFILKNIDNKAEGIYQSLVTLTDNGNAVKSNRLNLGEDGKTGTFKTLFNPQGDLIMAGFYVKDKKFGVTFANPKGTFYVKASGADGSIPISSFNPKSFADGTFISNMNLLDGDHVILLASQKDIKRTPKEGQPFEYNYVYTYNQVHLLKLDNKGIEVWERIAKRSITCADEMSRLGTVYSGINNGNVFMIFTDMYYKYDGGSQTVIGPFRSRYFINAIQVFDKDGKMISDSYIKRLGNDQAKEAVVIDLISGTGQEQDDKNFLFMGCTQKILYGVKVSF